ncbi:hypothetical protein BH11PLA1_BH11PLA1_23840 [soil metagenome]
MAMRRVLILAGAVADGAGMAARPGAVVIEVDETMTRTLGGRVRLIATGARREIEREFGGAGGGGRGGEPTGDIQRIVMEDALVMPALVNAHTHLDLTNIGPIAHDASRGFEGFARAVMERRPKDAAGISAAIAAGARLSRAGGVAAVGDIVGFVGGAWRARDVEESQRSGHADHEYAALSGVSFQEFFSMGARGAERLESLLGEGFLQAFAAVNGMETGLSPHAPYSVDGGALAAAGVVAAARRMRLMVHVAESMQERAAMLRGEGPLVQMLRSMGLLDERAEAWISAGGSSMARVAQALGAEACALTAAVHCNDVSAADIDLLRSFAGVVYCPRSSAYFGHDVEFGPHRYRDMMARGVTVALGTDSIMNLPREEADRLSTWDEMRWLRRRDGVDGVTLLRMATVNGARVLGMDDGLFTFGAGGGAREIGGVIAVRGELRGSSSGEWIERALESRVSPEAVALSS